MTVRLRAAPARPWVVDVAAVLVGLGFGAVVAMAITDETSGTLAAPGGALTFVGRLAGLTGTYLLLIMVLLVGRLPVVERAVGQDRLLRWHRRLSPYPISLIVVHVVCITLGYAALAKAGVLRQLWSFVSNYPDLLAAMVGFGLLVMATVTSLRAARRRMRYETWWAVHLYTYLALGLSFAHQIVTGAAFVGHPLARWLWCALWLGTAGVVAVWRIGLPIARSIRYRLHVVEVRAEAPGVVSVVCSGRHLESLAVSGGQWFQWRFLTRELWWQAHPYSLSALPQPPYMRVTVKDLGDASGVMARLRPGTRVAVEGPYGAFTHHAHHGPKALLVAGGVGVTPLRALLEDLPLGTDVVVVVRASSQEDLVFRSEMAALVAHSGGRLHEVVGSRRQVRLDARALVGLVPDIRQREVYVCGPTDFSERVVSSARALGVPEGQVHYESFAL